MNSSYALLVRCARLTGDAAFCAAFKEAADDFNNWHDLIPLAEQQSMAPLLYHHLQTCHIALTPNTKLQLQGLTLRHRQANEVRTAVLAAVLEIFDRANMPALVLKGGALANLVYPLPELRPMSDLDILVEPEEAIKAQRLLQENGYQLNPMAGFVSDDHRHLPVLMVERNGVTVSLEIHRRLSSGLRMADEKPFADLWANAWRFSAQGQTAYCLCPADMLWHLYQHTIAEQTRLIRLVDITAVAEHYADDIDWAELRRKAPEIIAALSNLHFVTPLSANLRQKAEIQLRKKPSGAELALYDWPPLPRVQWLGKSRRQIFRRTFFPSEFSLRFYYGVANHRSCWRQRWFKHPFQVLRWWRLRRQEEMA